MPDLNINYEQWQTLKDVLKDEIDSRKDLLESLIEDGERDYADWVKNHVAECESILAAVERL